MQVIQENINGILVNKTDKEMSWRLVHDGIRVITLFESNSITETVYNIFLAKTLEECQTEIYILNLEYNY
jgi:hypothetical protein